ncbi:MAG: membrane protein insertion efficiency factor YidD [Fidelibacterota bacterium]
MRNITIALVIVYRFLISPLVGNNCRFQPTCSAYTILALKKYPIHRALWISTKRILRCHPMNKGGLDPLL